MSEYQNAELGELLCGIRINVSWLCVHVGNLWPTKEKIWKARTSMDIRTQAITIHALSKWMSIAYWKSVFLISGSELSSSKNYWLYYTDHIFQIDQKEIELSNFHVQKSIIICESHYLGYQFTLISMQMSTVVCIKAESMLKC